MSLLLILLIVLLIVGGGGGWYGYNRWGYGPGFGIFGLVLIIILIVYLLGGVRF
jgi:hypothetical protein